MTDLIFCKHLFIRSFEALFDLHAASPADALSLVKKAFHRYTGPAAEHFDHLIYIRKMRPSVEVDAEARRLSNDKIPYETVLDKLVNQSRRLRLLCRSDQQRKQ